MPELYSQAWWDQVFIAVPMLLTSMYLGFFYR